MIEAEQMPDLVQRHRVHRIVLEQLTGAMYLEKEDDMDHYGVAMEHLCVQSASPAESMDLISKIIQDL